jgi:hypothetical protein
MYSLLRVFYAQQENFPIPPPIKLNARTVLRAKFRQEDLPLVVFVHQEVMLYLLLNAKNAQRDNILLLMDQFVFLVL